MKCGHEQTIEVLRAEIARLQAERAELATALGALCEQAERCAGQIHFQDVRAARAVIARVMP